MPLETRVCEAYMISGQADLSFAVGTVNLAVQFDSSTAGGPTVLTFNMLDTIFKDYDVLLPVYVLPGYGDDYDPTAVPAVIAPQGPKKPKDRGMHLAFNGPMNLSCTSLSCH